MAMGIPPPLEHEPYMNDRGLGRVNVNRTEYEDLTSPGSKIDQAEQDRLNAHARRGNLRRKKILEKDCHMKLNKLTTDDYANNKG